MKFIAELLSEFGPVGPTVDDDVRRLINRYGAQPVQQALTRATKPKRGRKPEDDWSKLDDVITADAVIWLSGGDPYTDLSNYEIAKRFAEQTPGYSAEATMDRIERKLRTGRKTRTLNAAVRLSRDNQPHMEYLRALEALALADKRYRHAWTGILAIEQLDLANYRINKGVEPAAHLSMKEIEDGARQILAFEPAQESLRFFGRQK